uniref:Plasminogen receptor, C-terminal lysine transmembrane protein n=1 Tax=Oreochromis aureus TaxID=47969 RepID=A0AAZ1Y242_OREAU
MKDMIRNEFIRGTFQVECFGDKAKRHGHVDILDKGCRRWSCQGGGKEEDNRFVDIVKEDLPRMERQILMQNQMRERQMAMQIAWSREFLKYFGSFFAVATVGLTAGAIKRKNPGMLAPIIPLSFIFAYQMDSAYGTLIYRMRGEAENIMETENDRLQLPQGTPTFESIEKARRAKSSLSAFLEK